MRPRSLAARQLRGLSHRLRVRAAGPILTGPASRVRVSPTVGLADVLINTIGGSVDIGDYVFFGHDVLLLTGTHDFRLTGPGRQTNRQTADRDIVIERGAWIASRAVIIGPCRIGENAVIGCGCLIDFDVPPDTVVRVLARADSHPHVPRVWSVRRAADCVARTSLVVAGGRVETHMGKPFPSLDPLCRAVQIPRRTPPSGSQGPISGHQLGRV